MNPGLLTVDFSRNLTWALLCIGYFQWEFECFQSKEGIACLDITEGSLEGQAIDQGLVLMA